MFYRRGLPHYQPSNAIYFVTFRLAKSLPKEVVICLKEERDRQEQQLNKIKDDQERNKSLSLNQKQYFGKLDKLLDAGKSGPVWLNDPRIANIVAESIQYRDGKDYDLISFCIMPNHVHMIFSLNEKELQASDPHTPNGVRRYIVTEILANLKKYTARNANRILHRTGRFWQHESYDHVVRDSGELERIIHYVLQNPVKAGLVSEWDQWKWSYCKK